MKLVQNGSMIDGTPIYAEEEFVETDHPRDDDGQFKDKNGGGSNNKGSTISDDERKEKYGQVNPSGNVFITQSGKIRGGDEESGSNMTHEEQKSKVLGEHKPMLIGLNGDSIHINQKSMSNYTQLETLGEEMIRKNIDPENITLENDTKSEIDTRDQMKNYKQNKKYMAELDGMMEQFNTKWKLKEKYENPIFTHLRPGNPKEIAIDIPWRFNEQLYEYLKSDGRFTAVDSEKAEKTHYGIGPQGSNMTSSSYAKLNRRKRGYLFVEKNMESSEKLIQTESKINGMSVFTEAEFKEDDHPRDSGGQFADKGGGDSSDKKEKKYGEDAMKRAADNEEKKKEENEKDKKEHLDELQSIFPTAKKLRSYGTTLFIPIKKDEYDETYNRVDKLLDENGFKMDGFARKSTYDDSLYFKFSAKKDGYEPKKLDPSAVLKATQLETVDDFKNAIDYDPNRERTEVFWYKTTHVVDEKIKRNGINVETTTLQSDGGPVRLSHYAGVLTRAKGVMMVINPDTDNQKKYMIKDNDANNYEKIFNKVNKIIEKHKPDKSSEKLILTETRLNNKPVYAEEEFVETDHPRDDDGQFANKGNDKKTDKKYHGTINNRYSGSTTPMDIKSDEYMYLKTDGGEDIEFLKDDSIDDLISRYDMYHSEDWKNPGRVKLKRDENDLEYYIYQNKDSFSIDSEGREWPVKFRSMKQLSYDMLKRNIIAFSAADFKGFNIDSVGEMNRLGIPFHIYDELEKDGKIKIERPSKRKMILSLPKKSTEEFVETDHPRDNDGQFANKDGGGSSNKGEKYGKDAMKRAADNEKRKEEENKREREKQEKETKELFPNITDVYSNDSSVHFELRSEMEYEDMENEINEKLKGSGYSLYLIYKYRTQPIYSIYIKKDGYQSNILNKLAELTAAKLDTVEDFTEAVKFGIDKDGNRTNSYWSSTTNVLGEMLNRSGMNDAEVYEMTRSGTNGRIAGMGSMFSSGVMIVLRPRERYNKGKFIFRSTDTEKNFNKITKIISDNTESSEKLVQTEGKINGMKVFTEAEFKEEEHPRDEGGQFSDKDSGSNKNPDKKEEKYGEDAIKRAIDNEEKKKEENRQNIEKQKAELKSIFSDDIKIEYHEDQGTFEYHDDKMNILIPSTKDTRNEIVNSASKLLEDNDFATGWFPIDTVRDGVSYVRIQTKKNGYNEKKSDRNAVLKATKLDTVKEFETAVGYGTGDRVSDFWPKVTRVVNEKIRRNDIDVRVGTATHSGSVRTNPVKGAASVSNRGVTITINPDTNDQKKYMIKDTDQYDYERIFNRVNKIIEKHKPDPDKLNKIGEVYMKKNGKIISVPVWSKKDINHFSNLALKSMEFDEDKHSRDQDGKFSEKEGGGIQKDLDRINKQTQSADDKYSDFVNGEIVPKWKKSVQELGDELDIIKKKQMPIWSKLQKEKTGHFENGDFDSPEVKKLARGIYNAKKAITDAENRIPSIRHGRLVEQQKILKEQYKKLDRDSERSKLLSGRIDDLNYAIHEAKFESDNREYYRDYSKQDSSEFDESDHPRGQPDNSGQFVEKEGGKSNNDKKTTKKGSKRKRGTDELYSLMNKSYDPWADPDYKLRTFTHIFEPKNEMKTLQSEALVGKWKKEWDKYGKIFHDEDGNVDIERIYEKIEQLAIKRKDTKTIKLVDNLKMGADTYNDFMEEVHSSDKKLNRVLTLKEAVQIAKDGKFKEVRGEYGRMTGNPEPDNNMSKSFTYMDNHNFKTHSSIQMSIDKDELPFQILEANWKPFGRKHLKSGVSFDGAEMQMEARLITTKPVKIPEKTMKNIEMTIGKDAVVDDESLAILASKFKIVDLREKGMEATEVRNDDLLLRMVRMRMNGNNLMYKDGVSREWIISTIQSWGQGLEDGDVDNAIREGILVDAGRNFIGQKIYKPAE